MKTPTLRKFLHLATLMFAITAVNAANVTWDANTALAGAQDGSGIWDTNSLNWWTGTANAAFVNGVPDVPTFGAGGVAGTVTLGTNITSGNIIFAGGGVGNYTIAGGGFQLALTNRTITPNVSATISASIFGGAVSLANSAATAPSAVLTLSGNNTFTNFNLGANAASTTAAVRVGANGALGVPSGQINVGGGQGNLTGHRIELTGGVSISNNVTCAGRNIAIPVIVNLSSGNTIAGTWTRTTGGADLAIESAVANGLTLSGAANGGIALASQAGAPRNYVLRGAGGGTVSGVISNGSAANNLGIVKAGSGTWTFSGANTYTNSTIVDDGTLTLDYSAQDNSKLADQGALTLGGGAVNLSGGSHTEVVFGTTILGGNSSITRSSGGSTLRLNALTRSRGGVVDFGAASIADTDTLNVNGILGGYATVAGADWAINSTSATDGAVTAYSSYTDIAATGSTIADGATSNVRLNSAGGGGNISLGLATTTVNTLLQNTTTAATVDTTSGTLRLGATGGVLLPAAAQSLTIGTAANAGTLTAGGADNTSGEIILINNSANGLTVNSTIANNGSGITSLTKAGTGTTTLTGNNTHTGTNLIVGGTLNISSDANLGTAPGAPTPGTILVNGGVLNATEDITLDANRGIALGPTSRYGNGTIGVASGKTLTISSIIANADTTGNGPGGSLTKTGSGTLVLGGGNAYSFGTIINGGTLSISSSGNLGPASGCYFPDHVVINGGTLAASVGLTLGNPRGIMLGPVGGAGVGTVQVDDSVVLQLDSRIADNWNGTGSLTKTGNGTLIITSPFNDYSGDTTVSAGILQVNNARSIPNGAGKGNVTVNGTMNINGVNVAINGLSGSGTVDNPTATAITLTVVGNGAFAGTIQNSGGGPLALVCNGALTLIGTSTYTGSTLINGLLALQDGTTLTATTNIMVGSGAVLYVNSIGGPGTGTIILNSGQTLSGSGTVVGSVSSGSGTVISPGSSAGTLTINAFPLAQGNLILGGGGALNYELANVTTTGGGMNDYLVVNGTLNVAGPTTLNLTYLNGLPASSGKYTLISYGSFAGNVNDISVPAGFIISNNAVSKTIELLVDHVPTALTWRGDGGGNAWDVNTTANWIQSGLPQFFFNGDTANFDNSGSNNVPVTVSVPVSPAAVNVNASQSYNFTGSSISSAALSKAGTGMLTLENDVNAVNGTTISGGIVQVGNGSTTGTLTGGNITNNGALVFNRSDDLVMNSAISGSGSVTQNGPGTSALTASNSYTGFTFVGLGRLYPRNGAAFGDISGGITVSGGAQIYMDVNVSFPAESLTLNGLGLASDGALRKGGGGVTAFGGAITLLSSSMINIDGGATLNLTNASGISGNADLTLTGAGGSSGTVSGPINLGGGAGVLTKTGSGSWTLAGANSMSLATIADGNLTLANNNALGTNLNVVLTSVSGGAGLSGTRLTLSGGLNIPANRSLSMPSSGLGTIRSAFFGTGAGVTNTWAGSVTLFGDTDPGNNLGFGVDANSTFVISGSVTADASFTGKLLMRGNNTGLGLITGTLALNSTTGQAQVDDGTTWVFSSTANVWATTIFANSSVIRLGVNNALPVASVLQPLSGNNNRLDLAGFNQQLAGMEVPGGAISLAITNSSSVADSTLTYASGGVSTFGGTISDGTRKLNLTIAAGTLVLTNPASLNLTKSTVSVAGGGPVLQLDYTGTNTVNAFVTNGLNAVAGLYSSANAAPYLAGTGYLLVVPRTGPATLTNSVSGNVLSFSWPAGQGWRLQAQTNSITTGISNNWVYVTDGSVSSLNVVINPGNPTVFFRLRYP